MNELIDSLKYKIFRARMRWRYGSKCEELQWQHYDEAIKRIVKSNDVPCLCEVSVMANEFNALIKKYASASEQARENAKHRDKKATDAVLIALIDDFIRQEIMLGGIFTALNDLSSNWNIDSEASLEAIEMFERYSAAIKEHKQHASSCHG